MSHRAKVISQKILYKGWAILKEYIIEFQRTSGRKENQIREIFNSGDGAAVLLYNDLQEKVLLVRQFRLPTLLQGHEDGFIWECCAGLIEDLSPEETIIKEIEEETGYRIKNVNKIFEAFASPGAHLEKIHFFVGKYYDKNKEKSGGGVESEQEEIEVREFSYEEIERMLNEGSIVDSKTIILLQWAIMNIIKNKIN